MYDVKVTTGLVFEIIDNLLIELLLYIVEKAHEGNATQKIHLSKPNYRSTALTRSVVGTFSSSNLLLVA